MAIVPLDIYNIYMDQGPLNKQIVEAFDAMPAQLQAAARYILDHPRDVALLSTRQQARLAGVQPATMTRLAQRFGLEGYEAVRKTYAEAMRSGDLGFSGKAGTQIASQKLKGDKALAAEIVNSIANQILRLVDPSTLDVLSAAASSLASARRVYCLGLRASHSVTWYFHYIQSLLGDKAVLLDTMAAVGADSIRGATESDVLLVVSVQPYTRATVEIARYASSRGVPIIAITDSEVAPLAQIAKHAVFVATESPSFFHTMAPAFVVAEVLSSLVAGRGGKKALEAIKQAEEQLAEFKVHWIPRDTRR